MPRWGSRVESVACCEAEPSSPRSPGDANESLARVAKALGHPSRVGILRTLLARDRCVCGEIVESLPRAQSTVSQHLKALRDAGLIRGEIEGQTVCYCANRNALGAFRDLVDELLAAAPDVVEEAGG